MKRALRWALCVLLWLAALVVGALESCCVWVWVHRAGYLRQWGPAENPYAAEELSLARLFALLGALPTILLVLLAAALTLKLLRRPRPGRRLYQTAKRNEWE